MPKMPGIMGLTSLDMHDVDTEAAPVALTDSEMAAFDSLCDYANNLSLQDETASDLIKELVARGADQADVSKFAPSSIQYLLLARRHGAPQILLCKGCGQQSSKKKHKCGSSQQAYWSKLLTSGGGWQAAFKALDRRGWWLDLSSGQAKRARQLNPQAAWNPIKRGVSNPESRKTRMPKNMSHNTYISGQGVQTNGAEAAVNSPIEMDTYIPEYVDKGPPLHSKRRAVYDALEPEESENILLLDGTESDKIREKGALERVSGGTSRKGKRFARKTQVRLDRSMDERSEEQLLPDSREKSQESGEHQAQQPLPQFDLVVVQKDFVSLSLG
jgi:hypothetical protein